MAHFMATLGDVQKTEALLRLSLDVGPLPVDANVLRPAGMERHAKTAGVWRSLRFSAVP